MMLGFVSTSRRTSSCGSHAGRTAIAFLRPDLGATSCLSGGVLGQQLLALLKGHSSTGLCWHCGTSRRTPGILLLHRRCCMEVELTDIRDRPIEDDREMFVVAWCSHPSFIEPEKLVFIPEPRIPWAQHDIHEQRLRRGLHYLIRVRLVMHQNFEDPPGTPPPADDGDHGGEGRDNDDQDDEGAQRQQQCRRRL